jgi:excisionase family DNA binding protein
MKADKKSTVPLPRLAYSLDETSKMFGVSRATLYRMVGAGEIRPIAHSGVIKFSQREIDRYLSTVQEVET